MNARGASGETSPATEWRWTSLNIWLHWLIFGLVVVQFFAGDAMAALFEATVRGEPAGGTAVRMGYAHIVFGATIFGAMALRLWDRWAHGRPPYPAAEPAWATRLAKATHLALYAILLAMPLAGALAWFAGNETVAGLHAIASRVLLALVALHLAGALANQIWFKSDALVRMSPGAGRSA